MNKKTALIKSLLKGDVINILNSIKLTGYSNPAREMTREVEIPFNCKITRLKRESKDQFGNYVMWYDYKLDKKLQNIKSLKKMEKYVYEQESK